MKNRFFAGLLAAGLTVTGFSLQAQAACEDTGSCHSFHKAAAKPATHATAKHHARVAKGHAKPRHFASRSGRSVAAFSASPKQGYEVVSLIQQMAPSHGVPTWFALRIAKVESNYNPRARGNAGELGVFQMKCATARGIGYRGSCEGLLDARTGVDIGLRHLALAIKASGGNLQMAASKHNGGLGRKRVVPRYVAQVF